MRDRRQMHLIAFLMTGPTCHHHGAWRHPESAVDDLLSPGRYEHTARAFADPAKIHHADHAGQWARIRGPLTTLRSPQGRPVTMQAGSSDHGRDFGARRGEAIFTLQHTKADMQAFHDDFKGRMALQKRGVFRTEHAARTLRGNLRA